MDRFVLFLCPFFHSATPALQTMLGFMVQLLQQFSGINAVSPSWEKRTCHAPSPTPPTIIRPFNHSRRQVMYFAPVIFKKFLASNMVSPAIRPLGSLLVCGRMNENIGQVQGVDGWIGGCCMDSHTATHMYTYTFQSDHHTHMYIYTFQCNHHAHRHTIYNKTRRSWRTWPSRSSTTSPPSSPSTWWVRSKAKKESGKRPTYAHIHETMGGLKDGGGY